LPLNGETISFAGTLGKRVTAETKTDVRAENESERGRTARTGGKENERGRERERERERETDRQRERDREESDRVEKGNNETRSSPKASDGRARGRRVKRKGGNPWRRQKRGRVAFNSIS